MIGRVAITAAVLVAATACAGGDDEASPAEAAPATSAPAPTDPPSPTAAPADDAATVAPDVTTPPATAAPAEPADSPVHDRCDPVAAADAGPITLRVWHAMSGDAEGFVQLLADRFESVHPQFRVEIERIDAGYPAAIDRLSETPDDQLPDLVMGSNQTVRLQADSGRFIPPVECNDGAVPNQFTDLLPVIRRTFSVDDTLLAAPFNISVPVMLYDQKRWERAGLDPTDPPSDFTELVEVIRQLADSGEAATGAVLYDRSALWFVEQPAAQLGELLVEPANGRAGLEVDRVLFNRPDAVDVLTTLQELKRDGSVLWSTPNFSNEDLAQLVHPTEPSGLTFNSSAVIGDIIRLFEVGAIPDVEIGIAPFPGPGSGSTVGGGAWWIVDTDDPARAGAAWILADWLTQPDLVAEFAAYTGYIPTTPRAADHEITQQRWTDWPILRVAYDQALAAADTDAAAGLQVGPLVEVHRNLELAAAYAIDVGNDPETELVTAEDRSLELLDLYADAFATDD